MRSVKFPTLGPPTLFPLLLWTAASVPPTRAWRWASSVTDNSELDCYLTLTESKGFLFLFEVFLQILRWTSILSLAKLRLQRLHWTNPGLGANFTPPAVAVFVLLVCKYCPAVLPLLLPLPPGLFDFAGLIWVGGFLCWYSCFLSAFRLLVTDTLLGCWTWRKGIIRDWIHESEVPLLKSS